MFQQQQLGPLLDLTAIAPRKKNPKQGGSASITCARNWDKIKFQDLAGHALPPPLHKLECLLCAQFFVAFDKLAQNLRRDVLV